MIEQSLLARMSRVQYQILATLIANVCCLGYGTSVGWTSPTLPKLLSDSTPFAEPVSAQMAAWIGAVLPLGAISGTLLFGTLSNFMGSKHSMLLCALPVSIHWAMLFWARDTWMLICARFISGLTGGGVVICLPLFVAEIANEGVRGQLSSLMQVSFNSGIVLGFVACSYLDYYTVPWVLLISQIAFFSVFIWLPSTPQMLLKQNKSKKAERSLRYYRNIQLNDNNAAKEQKLQDELLKFVLIAKENAELPPVQLSEFLTREALRGMIIGPVLMAVSQFSGTFTLSNYANTIFRASGTTIDPNTSSIVLGIVQVVGTICASSLIDCLGRKLLLLISCGGSAVALTLTGVFAYLNTNTDYDLSAYSAFPVVTLSAFIFIAAVGVVPVPYVLVSEVLPQRIRRIGATICVCTVSIFASIMLRCFPVMLATFELYGCMWVFAAVSVAGFVFTLIVVEETKGKNLDQLQRKCGENSDAP